MLLREARRQLCVEYDNGGCLLAESENAEDAQSTSCSVVK